MPGSAGAATSVVASVATATTGRGSLLVAVGSGNNALSVTSATDTRSNTYVRDYAADNVTTGGCDLEIWRAGDFIPLTTSDSVTANVSTTAGANGLTIIVDQFTYLAAPDASVLAYSSSTSTAQSATITTTASDITLYASIFTAGAVTGLTVSSPFTATSAQVTGNVGCALAAYDNSPPAGGGNVTATFTWTTAHTAPEVVLGYPAGPQTYDLLLGFFM